MGFLAMKNLILFSLVALFGLALLGGAQLVAPPPTPPTGKVLVLDNEHTLEGDIDLVGQQYRIRRTIGETFVPASRVLIVCASMEEAFRFLRGRCNLHDPDERLKLAEWCRVRGLRDLALEEAKAAVALRPEHTPSQRLVQILTAMQATQTAPGTPGHPPVVEPAPLPSLDLSAEAMTQFTTRVQPILMNACAGCHATGKGGVFKLTRTYESSLAPQRTTITNAAAVLAQVNLEQPSSSPLLTKAINLHGTMTAAPFRDKQAPAYRALEEWVRAASATHPAPPPREVGPGTQAPAPAPSAPPAGFAADRGNELPPLPGEQPLPRTLPVIPSTLPEPGTVRTVPTTPSATPSTPAGPARQTPLDPFDPERFNRQNTPTPPIQPVPPTPPTPRP
jgi:hypothetical protein